MSDPSIIAKIKTMVAETRGEAGEAYIQRIVSSMRSMRSHILPPTRDVAVWLDRSGIPKEEFQDWISRASQTSGLSNLEVCLILRLFTEEIPGIKSDPVCGENPRCGDCLIRSQCPFYTGIGKSVANGEAVAKQLKSGADAHLDHAALMSLALFGENPDARQNDALKSLMESVNGNLGDVIAINAKELLRRHGLSDEEAVRFLALQRLFGIWRDATRNYSVQFTCGKDFFDLYHLRLRDLKKEEFWVALLNQQNQFIGEERVSEGILMETPIHPREVFAPAIRSSAAKVAFVHNHPGGNPEPSPTDIDITNRLQDASKILGIPILDHVIIAPGKYYSFAEFGKLSP